jgi:spermidine synthase
MTPVATPLISLKHYLLFLSFLEGGSVMAVELLGARMLAPYFGTSLPVWAAALGLTLGGLAAGYFLGGLLSLRFGKNPNGLYYILLLAGAFIALMPITSHWIMGATVDWDLRWGSVVALLFFMVPPLVLLGMTSPIIIELITYDKAKAGKVAGTVYAISTVGGILFTFATGFWIISTFGISNPCFVLGALLSIFPLFSLVKNGSRWPIALIPIHLFAFTQHHFTSSSTNTLYKVEGIMGQITVRDFTDNNQTYRGLFVNNTLQTVECLTDPQTYYWPYTHMLTDFITATDSVQRSLLVGMAGGTLIRPLNKRGIATDIVEIDPRMVTVANEFFGLDKTARIIIDDGRHYINTSKEQYDLVIFDSFQGESAPGHLLTQESLDRLQGIMPSEGLFMINFYGFDEGPAGAISHLVYQTLVANGWHVLVFATPGADYERNLEFVASPSASALQKWQDSLYEKYPNRVGDEITPVFSEYPSFPPHQLLTDDNTQPLLYAEAAKRWRALYRIKDFNAN